MFINPLFIQKVHLKSTIQVIQDVCAQVQDMMLAPVQQLLLAAPIAGRLAKCMQNWKKITTDPWVLQTIQGYQIDWLSEPVQEGPISQLKLQQQQVELLSLELVSLHEKGAISEVVGSQPRFLSHIFLVPKKDGSQRPVINLKALNKFVAPEHFKMEHVQLVKELLQEGDWLVKMDLKDAYVAVPINRKYLCFQWEGRTFKFSCLPFGLASAPRVFTKIMKPAVAWLRQLGMRIITYIDDNLLMAPSKEEVDTQAKLMVCLFESLGLTINFKKSSLQPSQEIEFLGFKINSVKMLVQVPQEKMENIQVQAYRLLAQSYTSPRELAHFIGRASSMIFALLQAPLFYRSLQALQNQYRRGPQDWDSQVQLLNIHKEELHWWATQAQLDIQIDLQMDNMSALTYINKRGVPITDNSGKRMLDVVHG